MSFEPLIVRNLSRAYPDLRIEADFQVRAGERVALFAPSGSGKTTLLRIIAGLEPEEQVRGEIRIGEQSLIGAPPEKRNIGMVFQEGLLFPQMTAAENVAYPLKLRGVDRNERRSMAQSWLKKLELEKRADHFPHELSGGERQRVAFARALVFRPRLILMDEAFSALDLRLRTRLSTLFTEVHAEFPVPMLFVTHDSLEKDRLATRVLKYSLSESQTTHSFTD